MNFHIVHALGVEFVASLADVAAGRVLGLLQQDFKARACHAQSRPIRA